VRKKEMDRERPEGRVQSEWVEIRVFKLFAFWGTGY
jgi:hypothetical protein